MFFRPPVVVPLAYAGTALLSSRDAKSRSGLEARLRGPRPPHNFLLMDGPGRGMEAARRHYLTVGRNAREGFRPPNTCGARGPESANRHSRSAVGQFLSYPFSRDAVVVLYTIRPPCEDPSYTKPALQKPHPRNNVPYPVTFVAPLPCC